MVRTGLLVDMGYLDSEERPLINELFAWNPLAFDFVLKRRLRLVQNGEEYRFANEVFESARVFEG